MLKRLAHFFLSVFYILLGTSGFAQSVRPYPMTEKSLLWKVQHPEKAGEIHLFGTMHLMEKAYFYFPKKLEKLVEKSDVVVMELAGMPSPAEAMKHILLPKDANFFDFFSPAQRDTILQWAQNKLQMDETTFRSSFSKMKPFALVQMVVQLEFLGKTESYEVRFEGLAKSKSIPLEGLETIADQMRIFDRLTKEQQSEMVMESIREGNDEIDEIKRIQQVYTKQDLDALYALIDEEEGVIEEMESELLTDRNINWTKQLANYMDGRQVFVAVGAAHLGGPKGLIRLLEAEGYVLTPIEL